MTGEVFGVVGAYDKAVSMEHGHRQAEEQQREMRKKWQWMLKRQRFDRIDVLTGCPLMSKFLIGC